MKSKISGPTNGMTETAAHHRVLPTRLQSASEGMRLIADARASAGRVVFNEATFVDDFAIRIWCWSDSSPQGDNRTISRAIPNSVLFSLLRETAFFTLTNCFWARALD